MARFLPYGMAKPWSGALLAFLVWFAYAPSVASAGCLSQHLKRLDAIEVGANHPDRLLLLDLSGSLPPDPSDLPRVPTPPCRGALCSGAPATPHSQTPAPSPLGEGKWAACFGAALPDPSETDAIHPQDAMPAPSTSVDGIFHPPRSL